MASLKSWGFQYTLSLLSKINSLGQLGVGSEVVSCTENTHERTLQAPFRTVPVSCFRQRRLGQHLGSQGNLILGSCLSPSKMPLQELL